MTSGSRPGDDPSAPFDRVLHRHRRDRAASRFQAADFLKQEVAEEIGGRIAGVNRRFGLALDLGSHTGALAQLLRRRSLAKTVVASDLSEPMAARAGRPSLVLDEERLPFAASSFDLIVSALSLHSVNDLPGVLLQARRALKPDGLFIAGFFGGRTLAELRQVVDEAEIANEGGLSPHVAPFADVRVAGALLQRAGFALPVADADCFTVRYDNAFKLIEDLRSMGETSTLAARRRTPMRRATFADMARRYAESYADADGRVRATFEVIYATGWAPHESQPKPLRPGSATTRLADALGVNEHPAGDKAEPGGD